MQNDKNLAAFLRTLKSEVEQLKGAHQTFAELLARSRNVSDEIDQIEGRRIFFNLSDAQEFTITQDGQRGNQMTFLVSQDGPFVMTHYPWVAWRPSQPSTATNFGQWSPVYSWPLPDQELADRDVINLSYEFSDGGSQRNFQNEPAGPAFSRPDSLLPLPVPTLFAPNTTIQFTPIYEDILFASPATPTTGGTLVVTLYGYRIANL